MLYIQRFVDYGSALGCPYAGGIDFEVLVNKLGGIKIPKGTILLYDTVINTS